MGEPADQAPAAATAVVLGTVVVAIVLVLLPDLAWLDDVLVANLVALVTCAMAAVCAGWRAVRSSGRHRHAWSAISAGLACWAVGEALWTWLQATGQDPFPSVADVAYLAFGPLVCAGLLLLPGGVRRVRRVQGVLDALAVSWGLLLISWQTALGAVVRAADPEQVVATLVSVAYPVIDVAVCVLAVLALARVPPGAPRFAAALLVAGLLAISVADSAFVYLVTVDGYEPGDPVDIAWNTGSGLLALAALADRHVRARSEAGDAVVPTGGLLPYVPAVAALVVVVVLQLTGRVSTFGEELALHGLIVLLMVRQYLTLRQNAQLTARIRAREDELRHLAFHDALTGLPNRALLRDRLQHALDLHARDHRPVSLLFLDLDGFKAVNDTLGHSVGDQLLVRIAERMRGAARTGDTVARLGGDEFAVLLESGDDPRRCATRIHGVLRDPFFLAGRSVPARASIGVVELGAGEPTLSADELLIRADTAMYRAKRSGRPLVAHVSVAADGS